MRLNKLLLAVLAVAVAGGVASFVWQRMHKVAAACKARGAVDTPEIVDTGQAGIFIQGWAADAAGMSHVEIWAGGKLLASDKPGIARADVTAALPQCKFPTVSGYSFTLVRGIVPPHTKALEVRGVSGDGKAFVVGRLPIDLAKPFGMSDTVGPVEADGQNLINGWAIAEQGPVKVRVLAGDMEVLALSASNQREDVAKAYPAWPQAATSGFNGLLPLRKLPRGSYPLRILFEDGKGRSSEIAGPQVVNNLPFGKVLAQHDKMMPPDAIELRAWLADEEGIRSARVETEAGAPLGEMKMVKEKQSLAEFPDPRFNRDKAGDAPLKQGDLYSLQMPFAAIPPGLQRLQVRVEDKAGNVAVLPGPLALDKNRASAQACHGEKLRVFYPGEVVNFRDNFRQLQELRAMAQGGCVEVGLRGRVEYLRTTKGKLADYVFDPAFPESLRKRDGKEMTGESLNELLHTALRFRAPLMVTLDGGVWADAKFAAPDLDIVDMLEQDESTVQWNQFGKSEPDDALRNLPGATESPELARMMSLNRYNRRFLDYKKRNLQAAVREIVKFNRERSGSYVMVNFDPDEYINPWFHLIQWYDYNPDTLRQYREWLFHLGPYADGGELAFSRREPALTLEEANRLAKQSWKELGAVEPPRGAIDYSDSWQQLWTQFKRHLVARHYDDLAAWAVEAGLPKERIYTSQTFIKADVAVSITDTASNWIDQAGVSIGGAKPRSGHLGAILYGPGSRNEGKPRSGSSLIDNIRRADPAWGMVEFHPASIAFPEKLPTHAESYATMQALINGGAHFLSPMWGSYAGDQVVHPNNFKAYDVMEGSAFEYQFVWWLRAMHSLPVGSRFYPFGNDLVKSADGWGAGAGTTVTLEAGRIRLSGNESHAGLVSPGWDETGKTSPMRVEIKGRWPEASVVRALLLFDDGRREQLPATKSGSGVAVFRIGKPPHPVQKLELEWSSGDPNSIRQQGIEIDSIAVFIESK